MSLDQDLDLIVAAARQARLAYAEHAACDAAAKRLLEAITPADPAPAPEASAEPKPLPLPCPSSP